MTVGTRCFSKRGKGHGRPLLLSGVGDPAGPRAALRRAQGHRLPGGHRLACGGACGSALRCLLLASGLRPSLSPRRSQCVRSLPAPSWPHDRSAWLFQCLTRPSALRCQTLPLVTVSQAGEVTGTGLPVRASEGCPQDAEARCAGPADSGPAAGGSPQRQQASSSRSPA